MKMDEFVQGYAEDLDSISPVSQLAKLYQADNVPLTSILDVSELWLLEAIVQRSQKHRDVTRSPVYNSAATVLVKKVLQSLQAKKIEQASSSH